MVDPYTVVRRLTGHELISPKDARLLTEAVDGLIDKIGSKDARIAELEAALHIATNDKLSLLDQLDREKQARMAQIDYGCDLQRIIEDLCRGGPIREPKTSARHHYNMAVEALSRTGAVKVPSGEIREIVSDLEYWSERLADMRQPQGQSSLKHAASILSALEPVAPEDQQEPVAWGVFYRGKMVAVSLHKGYHYTVPLYTRPSERAVTEAWRPIETAPKDGTQFQAWIEKYGWEPRARFNPDSEAFELWSRVDYDKDGWDVYSHMTPTHWMPLPTPPAKAQEQVNGEAH